METFLQDLRFSLRSIRRNPLFIAIAVLCLTLGIAVNTTVFSTFNAILLRPFDFATPRSWWRFGWRIRTTGTGTASLG